MFAVNFEEFVLWLPENSGVRYELHKGNIIEMAQPTIPLYSSGIPNSIPNTTIREKQEVDGKDYWMHDHGIAMGGLMAEKLTPEEQQKGFEVTEKTAMQSAATPGVYRLSAVYLNRETGETYPIKTNAQITIDPQVSKLATPELDLVTQLRLKSANIGQGLTGIEPIFELTNRINQYDSIQDYVLQADKAFSYRLQQQNPPDKLSLAYGLAISKVLQQDVAGAIKATEEMIKIDPHNPYHYAYQGFIYLYDWQ